MLQFWHHTGIGTGMKKVLFLLIFIMAFPAQAAEKQSMIYDIYASGLRVLEAQLDIETSKDRYTMKFTAHTQGFLGTILPWQGTYETTGNLTAGDALRPELYKSDTVWRKDVDGKEYRYAPDGTLKELFITKKGKTEKADFDAELAKGTVDDYTSALKVFAKIARGEPCEGEDSVFDEKRRYTQKFEPLEKGTIAPTDYNVYAGDTALCTIEVVPDGGKWHKKPRGWLNIQEQGRRLGQLPKMWAAKMDENAQFAVPVKVLIKTDYGALVIHLAEYRNGDKILTSKKRKK